MAVLKHLLLFICILYEMSPVSADYPFRNVSLSFDERVNDLTNRLTLSEMMQQMAHELPRLKQGVPAIPRLGIKNYTWITECLRGDVKAGNATSFPQALGLAATFSSDIVFQVARATGIEVRAKNNDYEKRGMYGLHQGLSCFSPVVNIMRDPRWGRNQETYGEDPYLTGVLAHQFVKGLQGDDPRFLLVNSGCKHFDAYTGPENIPVSRYGFDAKVSIRDLRTTFLPAFKKCVEAGTYNIMCSYNSINGIPSCANRNLLTNILRDEWGFRGYVVSDAGAIEHIIYDHHYFNNSLDTVVAAINAGVNLAVASFGFDYKPVYFSIAEAVSKGLLSMDKIRDMMKPMWYTRMRLGEFDPPKNNQYKKLNLSVIESDAHRELAKEAAVQSIVLLKNKNKFLPFLAYNNVSIIGPLADNKEQLFGDYPPQTDPRFVKTPLDLLSRLCGNLSYTAGCMDDTPCTKYDSKAVAKSVKYANLVMVCLGLAYNNVSIIGPLADNKEQLFGDYPPQTDPRFVKTPLDLLSRLCGNLSYTAGCMDDTPCTKYDSKAVAKSVKYANLVMVCLGLADNKEQLFGDYPPQTDPRFVKTPLDLLSRLCGNLSYTAGCMDDTPCTKYDSKAVTKSVKYANLVMVCLGLGSKLEAESKDRSDINLPGYQLQLLKDAVNKSPPGTPVLLILFNAGPVDISWAENNDRVRGIIEAFYPAQAAGNALFRVITLEDEKNNPAGRLPFTWPVSEADIPSMTNYSMAGRTYRYPVHEPLYPFGYGLSYTTFVYRVMEVDAVVVAGKSFKGSVSVSNTGSYSGDEVVQVYISWPKLSVPTPKLQLVHFQRVYIEKGTTSIVQFTVEPDSYFVWYDDSGWEAPTGEYIVYVGGQQPNTKKSVGSNILSTVFKVVSA